MGILIVTIAILVLLNLLLLWQLRKSRVPGQAPQPAANAELVREVLHKINNSLHSITAVTDLLNNRANTSAVDKENMQMIFIACTKISKLLSELFPLTAAGYEKAELQNSICNEEYGIDKVVMSLEPRLRAELENAVLHLDMNKALEIAHRIEKTDKQDAGFLIELLNHFRFDVLSSALKKAGAR